MSSFEVMVDSGQMSIVPFSGLLSTKYEQSGIYKIIEATPGDRICVSVSYIDQDGWGERVSEISARVGRYDPNMDGDFYGYEEGKLGTPGYDAACHTALGEAQAGMFNTGGGMGACSSSGFGDGTYPLRVSLDSNNKFRELSVDFFPEEWEDDCSEDEEQDLWPTVTGL